MKQTLSLDIYNIAQPSKKRQVSEHRVVEHVLNTV